MKKILLKDARCKGLELSAPVFLKKEDPDVEISQFEIEAYTGATVDRWWGLLAIEVDGILAAESMPILRDHERSQIVGYSTKNWKDGSFFVAGQFSDVTPAAIEVKGLAGEGFPWQASIGVKPLKVMSLENDAKATVNGKTIKGPAEIWLESEVFEVSFVPLGADSNTKVATFSKFDEIAPDDGMGPAGAEHHTLSEDNNMEITLALLEQKAPALLADIREAAKADGFSAGAASELARIKGVSEQAMTGHDALITTLMFDGKTTGPEAAVQILSAEKRLKELAMENLHDGAVPPVAQVTPPDVEDLSNDDGEQDGEFDEKKAAASFEKSKNLKKEFGDVDTYLAYAKAAAGGHVKILGKSA